MNVQRGHFGMLAGLAAAVLLAQDASAEIRELPPAQGTFTGGTSGVFSATVYEVDNRQHVVTGEVRFSYQFTMPSVPPPTIEECDPRSPIIKPGECNRVCVRKENFVRYESAPYTGAPAFGVSPSCDARVTGTVRRPDPGLLRQVCEANNAWGGRAEGEMVFKVGPLYYFSNHMTFQHGNQWQVENIANLIWTPIRERVPIEIECVPAPTRALAAQTAVAAPDTRPVAVADITSRDSPPLPGPVSSPAKARQSVTLASAGATLDERELRVRRREAQQARQQQRTLRNQQLTDAARVFRTDAGNLEAEHKERARAVDTEFRLEEVRLKAELDARVAGLEAELHKRLTANITGGGEREVVGQMQVMEQEVKTHQDRLFEARRQGAAVIQAARLRAEERKDVLFREMDQRALDRAAALGLTTQPEPILAEPIGGELTRQEQQWNERERSEIERVIERHAKLIAKFITGERLRAWERANLDEDFTLEWQERSELHALQTQQVFFNAFLMQAAGTEGFDQQAYLDRLTDNAEQQRLVKIRYEQIRRENAIKRREEKRSLSEI